MFQICVHTVVAVGILGYGLQTSLIQTTLQSIQEKYFIFLFAVFYQYHLIFICYSVLILFIVIYIQYGYKTHKVGFCVSLYDIITRLVGLYAIYNSVQTQQEAFVVITLTLFCNLCLVPCVKSVCRFIKLLFTSIYRMISRRVVCICYIITFNFKRFYTQ